MLYAFPHWMQWPSRSVIVVSAVDVPVALGALAAVFYPRLAFSGHTASAHLVKKIVAGKAGRDLGSFIRKSAPSDNIS
jgi:hypothetical protein